MSGEPGPLALRVPTLTEVVALPESADVDVRIDESALKQVELRIAAVEATRSAVAAALGSTVPAAASAGPAVPQPAASVERLPSEAELVQQVLGDLKRQVVLMLEYRMRETLAPILARATDALIRDARSQLANTLHEMVARAVAQEMARHRDR